MTPPRVSPSGNVAVFEAYPSSAPQAVATTNLVNHLRNDVAPPIEHQTRRHRARRRVHRGLDRLLARAREQAAAVHRGRRGPLRAAAVRDLPLARDPDPGGADEPAQHRRRARRHRARVPEGLVCQRDRHREGAGRAVDPGADVRRRVRPVDGLRGVPDLACARAVDPPPGRVRGRRRRDRVHRTSDHARRPRS